MANDDLGANSADAWRARAEKRLVATGVDLQSMSLEDVHDLVHELQVHQVELEMQNEELRRAKEAFQSLVANAPLGIHIVQGGKFVLINPEFEAITGYSAQELLGKDYLTLVTPEYKAIVKKKAIKVLKKDDTSAYEFQFTSKSDETRWLMETVIPTHYEGKRAVLKCCMDITEQKQLQDQVFQAKRMEVVGRLTEGLAHDFSNMLGTVILHLAIMLREITPDDKFYPHVVGIKEAAEQAVFWTRQLQTLSRRQKTQPREVDLNIIVIEIANVLRRLIGEDIELVLNFDPDAQIVRIDPGQLEQVLMNLAVNARDTMPQGGRLSIETAKVSIDKSDASRHDDVSPGPYTMLIVSDTGMGMDAETQSHIFEPFFTTKEIGKGTGLGLSTVYGIVKQSQGSIEVYTEPRIGTTFKIYLPRVELNVSKARAEAPSNAGLQGTETILVVEDEGMLRDLVCASLKKNGYAVLEANHGHDALALCESHQGPIHLLATDVVMPKLSGPELAKRVVPMHPEMKVLFMSGYTEDVIIRHGVLDETMHFIKKPFLSNILLRKVRQLLDYHIWNSHPPDCKLYPSM